MKDYIVFFDTETTGLPESYKLDPRTQFDKFPRVVQLSWILNGKEKDYIIKPDGWTIPAEAAKVHGITTERAMDEGVPWREAFEDFAIDLETSSAICAHNIKFDAHQICADVCREYGYKMFEKAYLPYMLKSKQIDTMMLTIDFVQAKYKDGRTGKWPTLTELHTKLFGEGFNAHNSLDDVRAMVRCYYELKNRKIIQ